MSFPRLLNDDEDEILVKYRGQGTFNRHLINFDEITVHIDKHTNLVDVTGTGDIDFQVNDLEIFFTEP